MRTVFSPAFHFKTIADDALVKRFRKRLLEIVPVTREQFYVAAHKLIFVKAGKFQSCRIDSLDHGVGIDDDDRIVYRCKDAIAETLFGEISDKSIGCR